jgi:hypothetical protein
MRNQQRFPAQVLCKPLYYFNALLLATEATEITERECPWLLTLWSL